MIELIGIRYNYTHSGHWNKPAAGYNVSKLVNGEYFVRPFQAIGVTKSGCMFLEHFIHCLVHKAPRINRIWLEPKDGEMVLIWHYETEWHAKDFLKECGLGNLPRLPFDMTSWRDKIIVDDQRKY